MRIHLVDNKISEYYEVDDNIGYYGIWNKIDELVEKHNYSCISFPIPEIDKVEHKIIIHWIELFGSLSKPYIEIVGVTELLFVQFEKEIERAKCRNERIRNNRLQ